MRKVYIRNICCRCSEKVIDDFISDEPRVKRDGNILTFLDGMSFPEIKNLEEKLKPYGLMFSVNKKEELYDSCIYFIGKWLDTPKKVNLSEYLENNLSYNYHYISRYFHGISNMTIDSYVLFRRVEKAKGLLSEGTMSMAEVAQACGFSNTGHLCTSFKKVVGKLPSKYKE